MVPDDMQTTFSGSVSSQLCADQPSLLFPSSAFMFRVGLFLITFEQVRPFFDIQLSDYCFFLSILLLLFTPRTLRLPSRQATILWGGWLVLLGSVLSLVNVSNWGEAAGAFARFVVLYGLFSPLALIHSAEIRKNLLFLLGGIFVNCFITLLQGTVFPGIADTLSINPTKPDISDSGRFQGLTSHPNIIGLCAALAILIGIGLLSFDANKHLRGRLIVVNVVCSIAALFSGSRAVWVSLVPGLVVLAISQKRRRQSILRMLVAVAVMWAAAIYLAPGVITQFGERLDTSGSNIYSDYGRLWSAVYTVVEISQKPFIGWGIDHLDDAGLTEVPWTGEVVGAHNTFLKYWHGAGLLGAVGFLALFLVPAKRMVQLLKAGASGNLANILGLGLGSCVLLFVISNLGPFDYNRFLYVPLFVFGGFAARFRVPHRESTVATGQRSNVVRTLPSQS
jgi:O-antigen ligase